MGRKGRTWTALGDLEPATSGVVGSSEMASENPKKADRKLRGFRIRDESWQASSESASLYLLILRIKDWSSIMGNH